jgi:SAM-dependent methyltransferase
MEHPDHVSLLAGRPGLREQLGLPLRRTGGTWADLGAGSGAFTLALADLLGPGATIYAVDRDQSALGRLSLAMRKMFSGVTLHTLAADFTRPLDLPALDGILMANALHFVPDRHKPALLERLRGFLPPGGQFLLVEYNTDSGNLWVPHPLSFGSWAKLAAGSGYTQTTRLAAYPSRFLHEIFSALSLAGPR